jgi:hypothetical protein
MIFLEFATLFVMYAGFLTLMVLLPLTVVAVLLATCARAAMMWVHGKSR